MANSLVGLTCGGEVFRQVRKILFFEVINFNYLLPTSEAALNTGRSAGFMIKIYIQSFSKRHYTCEASMNTYQNKHVIHK
jgi:hypothetical protein